MFFLYFISKYIFYKYFTNSQCKIFFVNDKLFGANKTIKDKCC